MDESKIALYMRVSSKLQADKNGTEAQKHTLRLWCLGHEIDYDKCQLYEDEAFSGKNADRPGFKAVICGVRDKTIRHVVSRDIPRLSRSWADFGRFVDLCREHGCELSLTAMNVDISSPHGRLMLSMIAAFSQYDREMSSHRTSEGAIAAIRRGEVWGGMKMGDGRGYAKVTQADKREMIARYDAGEHASALGREYGIKPRSVIMASWRAKQREIKRQKSENAPWQK